MAYTIEPITIEDQKEVIKFMDATFNRDEPMYNALNQRTDEELFHDHRWYLQYLQCNLSFKVVLTNSPGEICGLILNKESVALETEIGENKDWKYDDPEVIEIMDRVAGGFYPKLRKLMDQVQAENAFEILAIATAREHRRKNLSNMLFEASLGLARRMGHKLAIILCSSAYAANTAKKFGFYTFHQVAYKDHTDHQDRVVFFNIPEPHISLTYLVKEF